ncbi:peroxidase [Marchantia polymorpha subsp. ruderalis]|uniref:Peroxidase n=2 Tax=Marchantia polymorpha TaxID=3197 RepID=A0A176VMG8_MARPO|nr:hypothetical protein AXG93_2550s1350 [Marchantia polymorpha subsp. ruderalis]PTQ46970.1 hypothetical protein MARPO_0009s0082 [Marchantia polymorpha]BBN17365.1 hypothetical protein Mp_7g13970 [Marchantia polymorpha subsp. ruderalis]|eukprot:PTQ46970.1 hypothetical protein MARPO_0009s0082 [Marchantia polymorpha]
MSGISSAYFKSVALALLLVFSWDRQLQHATVMADFPSSTFKRNFYSETCPDAENIVFRVVANCLLTNPELGAGIIRMLFHDCFVNGCDASILLEGTDSELEAIPNQSLKGIRVIEQAKANLEAACPGVVTCADIIALAARDSSFLLGGKYFEIKTGRFDGTNPGVVILPAPTSSVSDTLRLFTDVGLSPDDLVVLLGGHTLGVSQCRFFSSRLYNFSSTGRADPTMDAGYRAVLQRRCPQDGDGSAEQELDRGSVLYLDNSYYQNLLRNQGLLQIDQQLTYDDRTIGLVQDLAHSFATFQEAFADSMTRMSEIYVKGPSHGEVRKVCSSAN